MEGVGFTSKTSPFVLELKVSFKGGSFPIEKPLLPLLGDPSNKDSEGLGGVLANLMSNVSKLFL